MKEKYIRKEEINRGNLGEGLILKALTNELKVQLGRNELDPFELARAIDEVIRVRKITVLELSKEVNVPYQRLLRIKKLLECNENTLEKIERGDVSAASVAKILYNLRDKTQEDVIIDEIIQQGGNERGDTERLVTEYNENSKFGEHLNNILFRFNSNLRGKVSKEKKWFTIIAAKTKLDINDTIEKIISNLKKMQELIK